MVQQFVNTANLDEATRSSTAPRTCATGWLSHDLVEPGAEVTDADLRRALEVREGLRAVLSTHNGGESDAAAHDRLERAAGAGAAAGHLHAGRPHA